MKKVFCLLSGLVVLFVGLSSCDKDDPVIPNEEEVITTFIYQLTPQQGGSSIELKFVDSDGDGGQPPVYSSPKLQANTTYTGTITLLNELEKPVGNITEEVAAEGAEHQFFFATTVSGLSVAYTDKDVNGKPVGLKTTLTTKEAGSGKLKVVLRHQPDKSAKGVASGDITSAGGETDIEISFNIDVQ